MSESNLPPDASDIMDPTLILSVVPLKARVLLPGVMDEFRANTGKPSISDEALMGTLEECHKKNKMVFFACNMGDADGKMQLADTGTIGHITAFERKEVDGKTEMSFTARAMGRAVVREWLPVSDEESGEVIPDTYTAKVRLIFEPEVNITEWLSPLLTTRRHSIMQSMVRLQNILIDILNNDGTTRSLAASERILMKGLVVNINVFLQIMSTNDDPGVFMKLLNSVFGDMSLELSLGLLKEDFVAERLAKIDDFLLDLVHELGLYLEGVDTSDDVPLLPPASPPPTKKPQGRKSGAKSPEGSDGAATTLQELVVKIDAVLKKIENLRGGNDEKDPS